MLFPLRRFILTASFHSCLFVFLIIGIQNSTIKSRVNLLIDETVSLPVGFIIGSSFISGSLLGNLLNINVRKNK